jgi:hypothetical protein
VSKIIKRYLDFIKEEFASSEFSNKFPDVFNGTLLRGVYKYSKVKKENL